MRLVSWNVNGLRACLGKGFLEFCEFANADMICLQDGYTQYVEYHHEHCS